MIDLSRVEEKFKKVGLNVTYEVYENNPAVYVFIEGVVSVVLFDRGDSKLSTYFRRSLTPIIVSLFVTSINETYTLSLNDYFEVDFHGKIVFAEEAERVFIESFKFIQTEPSKQEESNLN
jgi:hypothetical protein